MISIIGLGPSNSSKISVGAYRAIRSAPTAFVRTIHHPAVTDLLSEGIKFISFDYIYNSSETFDEVYARIADTTLAAASDGEVVYAVPGHPLIAEESVRILIKKAKEHTIEYKIIGSESLIEACLEALCIPLDSGIKIIDALSLDQISPDKNVDNLIYQVYDRNIASEIKLKLMEIFPDEFEIAVIKSSGQNEQVKRIPLYMLDRVEVDHLTSVWVPKSRKS